MPEQIKTKRCCTCKQFKALSEFHKNRTQLDGYQNECKICKLKYVKKYQQTEKRKITQKIVNKNFRIRHPERRKAQNAVSNAIATGKLPRANTLLCHYCPKPAQQYHHWHGYEKEHWLDVIPICVKCHNIAGNACRA